MKLAINSAFFASIILLLPSYPLFAQPEVAWMRTYDEGGFELFGDVYVRADGSYVTAGHRAMSYVANTSDIWITAISPDGNVIWSQTFGQFNIPDEAYSIIEADGGDLLIGGSSSGQFLGLRLTSNGDQIWSRTYGSGFCFAIIELKDDNFILAGRTGPGRARLLCINSDGDQIWDQTYGEGQGRLNQFNGLRETDGGVVAAGQGWDVQTERSTFFAVKASVEEQGRSIWICYYPEGQGYSSCRNIVSSEGGGFALAGTISDADSPSDASNDFGLVRINSDGARLWTQRYYWGENRSSEWGTGIERIGNSGYILVGSQRPGDRYRPAAVRVRADGNVRWQKLVELRQEDGFGQGQSMHTFYSVVKTANNELLAAGSAFDTGHGSGPDALLLKLTPDILSPGYISWSPFDTTLAVLDGDSIQFRIIIRNYGGDPISYCWVNEAGDTLGSDTSTTCGVRFEGLGEKLISCSFTDTAFTAQVNWHISVRNLLIAAHSPDTLSLALRRGTSQTFSLDTVRSVEGDPVQYAWTLTNLDNFEREETGTEASATVEFLRSGNYQMEGLAYRGESSDNVIWTIAVRSAILDFWPMELSLSVPADSLINFGVLPFNPASDSLSYRWELDGDSVGADSTVSLRFAWDDQAGRSTYAVSAIVMDGGEGDTVKWEVTVQDPNATPPTPPSIEGGEVPATFGITSVSPNPFNNSTTIRFVVPSASASASASAQSASSAVNLTLHDLTGREVRKCVSAEMQAGEHSYTLNGADLPAGIYLLKLEIGNSHKVVKVAIVR